MLLSTDHLYKSNYLHKSSNLWPDNLFRSDHLRPPDLRIRPNNSRTNYRADDSLHSDNDWLWPNRIRTDNRIQCYQSIRLTGIEVKSARHPFTNVLFLRYQTTQVRNALNKRHRWSSRPGSRLGVVLALPAILFGGTISLTGWADDQTISSEPQQILYSRGKPSEVDKPGTEPPGFAHPYLFLSRDGTKLLVWARLPDDWSKVVPLTIYDTATWEVIRRVEMPGDRVCITASPDARLVGLAIPDHSTLELWDTSTGEKIHTLLQSDRWEGHPSMIYTMAVFSPGGEILATAPHFGTSVGFWETATWKVVGKIEHRCRGKMMVFSPDDKTLATWCVVRGDPPDISRRTVVQFCDVATGEIRSAYTLAPLVTSAAFSPDGTRLILGSRDGFIRELDAGTGKELLKFRAHSLENGFISVAFSPTGRTVTTGSAEGTVKTWDANSGELLQTFRHECPVLAVCYFPDGSNVAAAEPRGVVKIWPLRTNSGSEKPKKLRR